MTRLRYDGLRVLLGSSLTNSATAVTFATPLTYHGSVADAVPTIAAGDYIPLSILDTNGLCSEIVWLTAYTAASTSGTIVRGMDGSTGQAHSTGDKIVSAPSVADFSPGAFDPTVEEPTNLVSWHRCDQGVTLTSGRVTGWAAAGGAGAFNTTGGAVGPWQVDSTHPSGAKPLLFDQIVATRLSSSISPATGAGARTVMAVVQGVVFTGGTFAHIAHYGENSSDKAYGLIQKDGCVGNHYWASSHKAGQAIGSDRPIVVATRYDGTQDDLWLGVTKSPPLVITLNTGTVEGLCLGSRVAGVAEAAQFQLYELMTWGRALSDASIIAAARKLAAYWNPLSVT